VEFNEASVLFVNTPVRGDDVADALSFNVVGDDDASVPLTMETDVLSAVVVFVFGIASVSVDCEGGCSSTIGSGGGGSSS
jgi:hypothetical protein